jgi:tetratricopeptide (TPR) repeat protein
MKFRKLNMQYLVSHIKSYALLILLFVPSANSSVRVFSQLNQFDKAPELVLPKLTSPSESIDLQKLARPAILIFGEAYNQQTLESLVKLKEIFDTIGLTETDLSVFLIISHTPDQQQMEQLRAKKNISIEILLDKNLNAFGDYGVIVLPSTVVIDKQGMVDLAVSGVPLSFADMVEDAILLATERITRQQFESSQSAKQQNSTEQESVMRAHRLTSLARQLARRNYTALALKRYRQALELDKTYDEARIGVARCLIKLNLIPDAIEELQKILQNNAEDVEANLVMSQIEIIQGGDGIAEGKLKLQQILSVNQDNPEANYLMGTACEAQGQKDDALNYYKKAARLLLETGP